MSNAETTTTRPTIETQPIASPFSQLLEATRRSLPHPALKRLEVPLPSLADFVLAHAEIVRGRVDRMGGPHFDHHDLANRVSRSSLPVEREDALVQGAGLEDRRDSLEPVPPADERIDDVHLDGR